MPSREDLSPVDILYRAQADGPAGSIDKNREDGNVRPGFRVERVQQQDVEEEVDVAHKLHGEPSQEAEAPAKVVDQTPGKDHCEDEFDDAVGATGYEGGVGAGNAS